MARVIDFGRQFVGRSKRPDWVGRILECKECGIKFRLEACDKVGIGEDTRDTDSACWYETVCPNRYYDEHIVVFDVADKNPKRHVKKVRRRK